MSDLSLKHPLQEAIKLIKRNLSNGQITTTKHFRKRLKDRDISMQDALCVLKNGIIRDDPKLDIKVNQWGYKVRGKTIDGKPLSIVVAISRNTNILITCMGK